MTVQLSESQIKLINKIAEENGFTDNFEVDTFPGTVKGDNYMGLITKVTIKNKERKLELILKSASISEAFRKAVPVRKVYCREQHIYENLLVRFKEFQDEFNITNRFSGYAKMFGSSSENGKECLVMENLLATGYNLWNRKIPMDAEHIKSVFIEYAKFHSISLAMAHKKPELFKELTKDIEDHPFQESIENPDNQDLFIKSAIASGFEAVEDEPKLTEVWETFAESIAVYFSKEMKDPKWNRIVTHGDCWCNNLMFKYDDTDTNKKISKVCILDWQLAKMGSPAADLTSFFLAHSPKEVLYDYKNYLILYHDTVSKNLIDFSCDPEEVFSYSLFEEHWNKFINYGIYMSMLVLKIMHYDTDEAPDIAVLIESGEELRHPSSFDLKNAVEYNRRVRDLMKFVVDTGLL